jgi:predicted nucleic acid-binding protein
VKLFLDNSVVLAACASKAGASRAICDAAESHGWTLLTSNYVVNEVNGNISLLPNDAVITWAALKPRMQDAGSIVSFDWVAVFAPAKDRPILFTAAAWSDVLLPLDRRDFGELLGAQFYSLPILKPSDFLRAEREAGRFM